jgi:hypothetical protein
LSSCSLCGGACATTNAPSSGVAWTDPHTTADSIVPTRKRALIRFRFALMLAIFFINIVPALQKVGGALTMLGSMAEGLPEECLQCRHGRKRTFFAAVPLSG